MKNNKETHKTRLLAYLKENKTITQLEAFEKLGNTRLAASIHRLRNDGYLIKSLNKKVSTRFNTKAYVTEYNYLSDVNDANDLIIAVSSYKNPKN
jgi:hypothetical protein